MIAETLIETEHASKYLRWVCSHFNLKVQADWDDTAGEVHFPFGDCVMQARPDALFVQVEAAGEADFARLKSVVGDHIQRFAKKEQIQVNWIDQPIGAQQ